MSRTWSTIPEAEQAGMRRRFALSLAADELAAPEPPADAGERRPRFDEMLAAAVDPAGRLGGPVAQALLSDVETRSSFEALLRDHALCWFPPAAAAAGEEGLDAREEAGFRVWIRPSSADPDQVYVLVRVAEGSRSRPAVLVALPHGGAPVCAVLPDDIDGVYQLVEHAESPLVRAVRDPASKLALR